jgi:hypothetical protein
MTEITIGSDAEVSFALDKAIKTNLYRADNFLTTSLTTQLGCDGCASIAELRPNYTENPIEHINNLKKILKRLKVKIGNENKGLDGKKIITLAGNGFSQYPTGGHIHFGIQLTTQRDREILKLLDIMAIFLMPMENKEFASRRRLNTGYGQLGAFERKSYGFEYRTLGSWLYDSNNARNILCLAYTLGYEFVNNRKFTEKIIKTVKNNIYSGKELNRKTMIMYSGCNSQFFNKREFNLYSYFMKSVRKMEKYQEYKPYIENLFSFFKLRKEFRENEDILENWDLNKTKSYFYHFNSNDCFIPEIKKGIKNKLVNDNKNLFIFGLNKNRTPDIITNNEKILQIINIFNKDNSLNYKVEQTSIYSYDNIGFSLKLRENNQDYIIKLLEFIKDNIDKEILKESYEETVDYEGKSAETDTEKEDDEDDEDDSDDDDGYGEDI